MKPTNSAPISNLIDDTDEVAGVPATVRFYSIDHARWEEVLTNLRQALEAHQLIQLNAPTALILHDLLDGAVKNMHQCVFRRVVETDFGLTIDGDEQLEGLFRSELNEHGVQNLARYCAAADKAITVFFPPPTPDRESPLLQIEIPFAWERSQSHTEKLIEALGFQLVIDNHAEGSSVTLAKRADRQPNYATPDLLDSAARSASVKEIFDRLSYGLIHFSAVGEIIAVSPSILARLHLDETGSAVCSLTEAIPLAFYNDIVWGLALTEASGAFENYRIRIRRPGADQGSILFNVSGVRRPDGVIHSLWQAVSHVEGSGQLSEGSILTESRIHNITRNYVPQLVAQKARDAVRLGKTGLSDEDRQVAVLFCDIVGFTSYVELHTGSESVIDTLNSILRRVARSVKRNNGSIDKFMGDCIMALFDDPADAVLTAIDMQSHSADVNSLRSRAGQQQLQLRIGIHWGEVVIGNVGTAERLDWTAIGDVVNAASRIEKGCPPGSVLVSRAVRDAIETKRPGRFVFGPNYGLQVKGKRDALAVCQLILS